MLNLNWLNALITCWCIQNMKKSFWFFFLHKMVSLKKIQSMSIWIQKQELINLFVEDSGDALMFTFLIDNTFSSTLTTVHYA